jgi:hypothetical protein
MSKQSEEFEVMISRIHELLEGEAGIVEWNERIPDPDNPAQHRQIDVTIRKGNIFNIIECRLHRSKQDVKWIEELIGRRLSLNADAVIAVSSSGFTKGAIKKANMHGIILKDLISLTDTDILNWSKGINLQLLFYRYSKFRIELAFDDEDLNGIDINNLQNDLQNHIGFRTLFTAHLDEIEKLTSLSEMSKKQKPFNFSVNFTIEDFILDKRKVQSITTEGTLHLEIIELTIPECLAYGAPSESSADRNIYIQKYNLGETSVIHHGENIAISLDLSKLKTPPYWQFRYVDIYGGGQHNQQSFELINPEKIIMNIDKFDLSISNNVPNKHKSP